MNFFAVENIHMYIAIVLAIVNGILMTFASYKFLQIFQISGYRLKGYFEWLKDTKAKYVGRIIMLTALSTFCVLVTNALFDVYHSKALYSYLGLIFYFYFTIVFIINLYSAPKKVAIKYTARMVRLNVLTAIFTAIFSFFMIAFSTEYLTFIKFGALCFVPIFMPIFVPFMHILLVPIEKLISRYYNQKARKKLSKQENLIKIGITGSFGKTSTKYILNSILSTKYKVCMSPHSFNTMGGLTRVVNDYLKEDDEILIAEMGARKVGEIKELCDFIKPKYGIITGIGVQHLLSFKTEENILKTKFELIESLPEDGFAVFNGENEGSLKLYKQCKNVKKAVSKMKSDTYHVDDIAYDKNGTQFTLTIGEKQYKIHTKLLGAHNVENIVLCAQMARKLGMTDKEILVAIENLEPIPHRLAPIKNDKVLVLDDAYNSNVDGSIAALEVLEKMPGHKIVVTPGLVELGKKEKEENIEFGKRIAKVADYVVIVNKVNFESIKQGLEAEKFNDENIYQAETLGKANSLIQDFIMDGDTVLFENDLPDNYI